LPPRIARIAQAAHLTTSECNILAAAGVTAEEDVYGLLLAFPSLFKLGLRAMSINIAGNTCSFERDRMRSGDFDLPRCRPGLTLPSMPVSCTDPVHSSPRTLPPPGDFGASVDPNGVTLPAALTEPLRAQGAVALLDVVSYLQSFPSAIAAMLNWSAPDVVEATRRFETQLDQLLPGVIPKPRWGTANILGARDPALLGHPMTHRQT
jgi:hypothetical protein